MAILYIIGNGFDLHHGMPTGYKNFGKFLKSNHKELRGLLDNYFPTDDEDDFWGHFEERLASFDADTLVDESEHFMVPYSAEDWSDAFHHDFAFELDRVVEALSEKLLGAFAEWIRTIAIPTAASLSVPRARIDPTGYFINFNYTDTLQMLYGVPNDRVWHIHGSASGAERLVLGHGWQRKTADTWSGRVDPEQDDPRYIEGAQILDRYFEQTFKPTARIIDENRKAFAKLAAIEDIRVLGHSLSDVDLPYLTKIKESSSAAARWRISYRGRFETLRAQFEKFAPAGNVSFLPLHEV